jgi:hypothetical protein
MLPWFVSSFALWVLPSVGVLTGCLAARPKGRSHGDPSSALREPGERVTYLREPGERVTYNALAYIIFSFLLSFASATV